MSHRPEADAGVDGVDLSGRTALVTGSTSGIGRETALALGRLGATVFVHGRDRDAGRQVASAIDDAGGDAVFFRADLADVDTVHHLADEIRDRTDRLDILVNNAGAHFSAGHLTSDGVEQTFAVNHLAPFVLTHDLHELLPNDGRVVTVSSGVHHRADGTFDVTTVDDYDGLDAYARSKLANILFTVGLARRLDGPTANCCHPGLVPSSHLWREASLPVRLGVGLLAFLPQRLVGGFAETPATGAATSVYLSASPAVEGISGQYFSECAPADPSATAADDTLARELWDLSEELTGISWS
ncbi:MULTISPECIES: SDR family oxidoreductase [Haloferax]|uniref:SDR family NAD(P)-dependent oxidoreductase n=2 Tax=Haloferax TaxID=2251 RepID=A0A6G1Z578_9EURY|nr:MULTISPECIES: SDR family oxidoreductase [Haloferax]KAB1188751.1 SDR family oxidoreductase [Haloferax sp. CBA1149]MRW81464.1 SDR family NAD(P)-dependent oxidoreductase [Haloferax marinisediminis]